MKNWINNHKTLVAFVILFLMLILFLVVTNYTNLLANMEVSSKQDLKVSGMVETLKRVEDHVLSMASVYREKNENLITLITDSLRKFASEEGYDGPEIFEDGVVVRIENDEIVYPENFAARFQIITTADDLYHLEPLTITEMTEGDEERTVYVSAREITDSLYYIDWADEEDYKSTVNYEKISREAIETLEKSYSMYLLLLTNPDSEMSVLYASKELGETAAADDWEITQKDILSEPSRLTINKKVYAANYQELELFGEPVRAIMLSNPVKTNSYVVNCILIAGGFILLCLSIFILWIHWIEDYSKTHVLSEMQEKSFEKSQVRKTSFFTALNTALLLFILLIGYQLLGNISRTSEINQETLDIIMGRLTNNSIQNDLYSDDESHWDLYDAKKVAQLYELDPEIRNDSFLSHANDLCRSEYIMVFNEEGKEIGSSNETIGFSLGKEIPSTEKFNLLLQGVQTIILDPESDLFSDKTVRLFGIRMKLSDSGPYGALIIAYEDQSADKNIFGQEIMEYVDMLTPQGNLSIVFDNKMIPVFYSSDMELIGKTPDEIGLENTDVISTSLDSFEILDTKYYGAFDSNEQYRVYYMMQSKSIWNGTAGFAIYASVFYLIIFLILCLFLLGTFHVDIKGEAARAKEKLQQTSSLQFDKNSFNKIENDIKDNFQTEEIGSRSFSDWWKDLTPGKRVAQLLKLTLTVILTCVIVLIINNDELGSGSVISFVMKGNWKRGLNELGIAAILCTIVCLLIFILIKDFLERSLCSMLDAKGETIVRLIASLLQYTAIIAAIFICLAYLGLDTGTLITSASILTLAISLGSKDLVADIMAGVFIIFEGDFRVGDIIEVDGFKGRVLDIGVRSTKLKDSSNNIKIIDNQSVKNVLNMSRDLSWCIISLTISDSQPLEEIEALLDRELPKIGKKIPLIERGPFYFGIDEIGYRRLKISIGAQTNQENIQKIKPYLNHHVWEVLKNNGYHI